MWYYREHRIYCNHRIYWEHRIYCEHRIYWEHRIPEISIKWLWNERRQSTNTYRLLFDFYWVFAITAILIAFISLLYLAAAKEVHFNTYIYIYTHIFCFMHFQCSINAFTLLLGSSLCACVLYILRLFGMWRLLCTAMPPNKRCTVEWYVCSIPWSWISGNSWRNITMRIAPRIAINSELYMVCLT